MMYFYLNVISLLLLIIGLLIGVAFLTLMERKFLGYIQYRKGPNKIGLIGLFQPFSDAIKLFSKEKLFLLNLNLFLYLASPMMLFLGSLILWFILPLFGGFFFFFFGFMFMFCIMSLSVYYIMMMGWSSGNVYGFLGGMRGVIQVISYEISMIMFILVMLSFIMNFHFMDFFKVQLKIWLLFNFPLFLMLLSSLLSELSRTPFDFIEGESELVSGFNIEFGGVLFTFIFLGEYLMIIFMSFLLSLLFMSSFWLNGWMIIKIMFFIMLIIWVRGSLPRYRYDKLMYLNWKIYLPISMNYLVFFFFLKLN
uniref:NADH-ubiquinone oxidoreductase chain 1 n=1 Tax=Nyctiophylax orbicularis TaxID=2904907 RepID=A0A9E8LPX3_9NEOP|nr:NADH dehydrogenase subunit 1 [Nyctiophylax orbicularis]UZZ44204.1 NADH dehydrogenase subunit 1 [Nyctiophylax orbicularis]